MSSILRSYVCHSFVPFILSQTDCPGWHIAQTHIFHGSKYCCLSLWVQLNIWRRRVWPIAWIVMICKGWVFHNIICISLQCTVFRSKKEDGLITQAKQWQNSFHFHRSHYFWLGGCMSPLYFVHENRLLGQSNERKSPKPTAPPSLALAVDLVFLTCIKNRATKDEVKIFAWPGLWVNMHQDL